MNNRLPLLACVALALAHWGMPAFASESTGRPAHGIEPISDAQLAGLRGRYTIGSNTVAWFGVQMISTWQDSGGRTLQGTMALAMDFTHNPNMPKVSFVPTVSIVQSTTPPLPHDPAGPTRSIDNQGLANVTGMQQSVQVAGDNNSASNVTRLTVQDGGSIPAPPSNNTDSNFNATVSSGDATVSASYAGNAAQVVLTIAGQGAVQQWIRSGSLGQSVTLATDNQSASNQMEITLIRQTLVANAQLAQNVAQSIQSTRGLGR